MPELDSLSCFPFWGAFWLPCVSQLSWPFEFHLMTTAKTGLGSWGLCNLALNWALKRKLKSEKYLMPTAQKPLKPSRVSNWLSSVIIGPDLTKRRIIIWNKTTWAGDKDLLCPSVRYCYTSCLWLMGVAIVIEENSLGSGCGGECIREEQNDLHIICW